MHSETCIIQQLRLGDVSHFVAHAHPASIWIRTWQEAVRQDNWDHIKDQGLQDNLPLTAAIQSSALPVNGDVTGGSRSAWSGSSVVWSQRQSESGNEEVCSGCEAKLN